MVIEFHIVNRFSAIIKIRFPSNLRVVCSFFSLSTWKIDASSILILGDSLFIDGTYKSNRSSSSFFCNKHQVSFWRNKMNNGTRNFKTICFFIFSHSSSSSFQEVRWETKDILLLCFVCSPRVCVSWEEFLTVHYGPQVGKERALRVGS